MVGLLREVGVPKRIEDKEAVLEFVRQNPSASYADVAAHFGITNRQTVANMVEREMRRLNPRWRKPNPQTRKYKCKAPGCGKQFPGEVGYSGRSARYCPEHRRKGFRTTRT